MIDVFLREDSRVSFPGAYDFNIGPEWVTIIAPGKVLLSPTEGEALRMDFTIAAFPREIVLRVERSGSSVVRNSSDGPIGLAARGAPTKE